MNDNQKTMIEKFQCPGCTCGCDTECSACVLSEGYGFNCKGHHPGTFISGGGCVYLGLPKGFNKVGCIVPKGGDDQQFSHNIRMWESMQALLDATAGLPWDHLNVPVWVMEEDGYLFVRTYCPRMNHSYIDIIKGGRIEDHDWLAEAANVSYFLDEID